MKDTDTSPGTDAGTSADDFDAQFEAAKAAEKAAEPPKASEAAPSEKTAEAKTPEGEQGKDKPPLTPEEVENRWKQSRAALKEERSKRQSTESELADLKRQIAELRGGGEKKPGREDAYGMEIPDPQQDPNGAFLAAVEYARRVQQEARQAEEQERQQTQQRTYVETIQTQFSAAEQEYSQAVPDYFDAVNHLREARMAEIQAFGYDEQTASQVFAQEAMELASAALQSGQHPAAVIYRVSQQRGYQMRPQAPDPSAQIAKTTAAIENRNKASKLTQSLSGPGGKSARTEPTIEYANQVKDGDEFDRLFAELAKQSKSR